jgi:hypothetical protein
VSRRALLIGCGTYDSDPALNRRSPNANLALLQPLLEAQGDFRSVDILSDPKVADLESAVYEMVTARDADFVLIYYCGHGLLGEAGDLYLATRETKRSTPALRSFPVEKLATYLTQAAQRPNLAVILDCCYSGAAAKVLKQLTDPGGIFVLTSSIATRVASAGEGDAPTPFSKLLIDGIQKGWADQDHDGRVTLDDLYGYIVSRTEKEQVPARFVTDDAQRSRDWLVARSRPQRSFLVVPDEFQCDGGMFAQLRDLVRSVWQGRLEELPASKLAQGRVRQVLFGVILRSNESWNIWALMLLKSGVPVILIGEAGGESREDADLLRGLGMQMELKDLLFEVRYPSQIQGAVQWVTNYYDDVLSLSARQMFRKRLEIWEDIAISIVQREAG